MQIAESPHEGSLLGATQSQLGGRDLSLALWVQQGLHNCFNQTLEGRISHPFHTFHLCHLSTHANLPIGTVKVCVSSFL